MKKQSNVKYKIDTKNLTELLVHSPEDGHLVFYLNDVVVYEHSIIHASYIPIDFSFDELKLVTCNNIDFFLNCTYTNLWYNIPDSDPKDKKEESKKTDSYCVHEWIDVGFNFSKMVCRKCDVEKKDTSYGSDSSGT